MLRQGDAREARAVECIVLYLRQRGEVEVHASELGTAVKRAAADGRGLRRKRDAFQIVAVGEHAAWNARDSIWEGEGVAESLPANTNTWTADRLGTVFFVARASRLLQLEKASWPMAVSVEGNETVRIRLSL